MPGLTATEVDFDTWMQALDKVADELGWARKDPMPPKELQTWRKLFDKGYTPEQAWPKVPERRRF